MAGVSTKICDVAEFPNVRFTQHPVAGKGSVLRLAASRSPLPAL